MMDKTRTILFGSVVGAALGVILAPRRGESRRLAVDRLRSCARPGRGAAAAFSGTPCSSLKCADPRPSAPASPELPTEGAHDDA